MGRVPGAAPRKDCRAFKALQLLEHIRYNRIAAVPHRTFRWLLIAVLVLGGVAVSGYFYARLSLPQVEGEIALTGLEASVEVLRDAHGIPHIFARSERDAQFALGFV